MKVYGWVRYGFLILTGHWKSCSVSVLSHSKFTHTATKWATKTQLISVLPVWNVKSQSGSTNCICIDFLSGDKYHQPPLTGAQKFNQFNFAEHPVQQAVKHSIWMTFKVSKTQCIFFIFYILGATSRDDWAADEEWGSLRASGMFVCIQISDNKQVSIFKRS